MLLPHMCNRQLSGEKQSLLLLLLELSLELEQQRVGGVLSIIYDFNQQPKISGYENEINLTYLNSDMATYHHIGFCRYGHFLHF